jgi:carbohydrate diacid regulator
VADRALAEIQRLQMSMASRQPGALTAIVGPCEMVVLDSYDPSRKAADDIPVRRLEALTDWVQHECGQAFTLAMGIALPGIEGAAVSYQSARSAATLGRARQSGRKAFSYYELALPVLLSGLDAGWQAEQLRAPVARLANDRSRDMLRMTLDAWFAHNENSAATAGALQIHRNTLDYRLRRVAELTGLDLGRTEDRFLLYVSSLLTPA